MKMPPRRKRTTSTATIFATASLLFPAIALAQVRITEVMYDAPGADQGHEWLEVSNLGSQNADIGKYKLFEDGTNHALKAVQGSGSLAPGASAIIAADAQKFLADYPAFSSTVFDSTFSLSNTGETLALKDASSTAIDTASYIATDAANGTGGTLNLLSAGEWAAAMASPGVYPGPLTPVPQAPAKTEKTTAAKKQASTSPAKNSAKQGSGSAAPNAAPAENAAAASLSFVPELSGSSLAWLGLAAVALLGVAGVFFIGQRRAETSPAAEEFTIE
ncbi:MAG TPA: lamin tail domain-containing protein [Candidatus Paceibacterota bacterium]|nr:lamin tail domain-containing protein [Candidatus Paceibacterota bacterium]